MAGHACACAGVGSAKALLNQSRTRGEKEASGSTPFRVRIARARSWTFRPSAAILLGVARWVVVVATCVVAVVAAARGDDVAPCTGAQLSLSRAGLLSAETGEIVRAFNLRNRGGRACALTGYPGVRLVERGRPLPFTYRWGGRYFGTRGRPRTVVLQPGKAGWFVVAKYRCDSRMLHVARELAAIPPDTSRRLRVRFGASPIFGYCRAFHGPNRRDPGNTVYVGPVHAHRPGYGP
jgi:hypothetical protein